MLRGPATAENFSFQFFSPGGAEGEEPETNILRVLLRKRANYGENNWRQECGAGKLEPVGTCGSITGNGENLSRSLAVR